MAATISATYRRLLPIQAFLGRGFAMLRRYWGWELTWLVYSCVGVLTMGFLAVGMGQVSGVAIPVDKVLIYLITGSLLWRYLSELFWETSNAITYERWEGTIEYTFMAPISRVTHLLGMTSFAMMYAGARLVLLMLVAALVFRMDLSHANLPAACLVLVVSTFSLVGLGLMAASLPLIYTEKGQQMTDIIEAVLLMISGVYYPLSVLPGWLQACAQFSPMTYTLRGMRSALLDGKGVRELGGDLWPLAATAVVLIPLGLVVFGMAERYCRRHGKLKRSG